MTNERTYEYYKKEFEELGRSPIEIAEEWNTYPNKIRRELIKLGFKLRNKSEAQKKALENGRHVHPTEGRKHDVATRLKISESMSHSWKDMAPAEHDRRVELGKAQWDRMSDSDKDTFKRLSVAAVRQASIEGSKLEKFLLTTLRSLGYEVEFHRDKLIPNEKLQLDLFMPVQKIAIEIDGPSHFYPIWGEETLRKNILSDNKKNQLLLAYGFVVVRVKHMAKTVSEVHKRKSVDIIVDIIKRVEKEFPPVGKRLIDIELT